MKKEMRVCKCGYPLVLYFKVPFKEYKCFKCGNLYEFFDDYDNLEENKELKELYKKAMKLKGKEYQKDLQKK